MINKDSESGVAEDLIRAYIQFGCAELHTKTLIEKYLSKSDKKSIEMVNSLNKLLEKYAEHRRNCMRKLLNIFKKSNKEIWCLIKHGGIGPMCVFEAYQNSNDDTDIYYEWIESNKTFIETMTLCLGEEVIDCAACFSDMLKGVKKNG